MPDRAPGLAEGAKRRAKKADAHSKPADSAMEVHKIGAQIRAFDFFNRIDSTEAFSGSALGYLLLPLFGKTLTLARVPHGISEGWS